MPIQYLDELLMNKLNPKFLFAILILMASLIVSLSAQAAAVEAELSKVTLFVEGMMKSSGGVT